MKEESRKTLFEPDVVTTVKTLAVNSATVETKRSYSNETGKSIKDLNDVTKLVKIVSSFSKQYDISNKTIDLADQEEN